MGFLKIGNLDSRNWKKLTRLEASQFLKTIFLKIVRIQTGPY
jgi:hypothetical protein